MIGIFSAIGGGDKLKLLFTITVITVVYVFFIYLVATFMPTFINSITGFIRIVICFYLMIAYNPFGGNGATVVPLDQNRKTVLFLSGFFIFFTETINKIVLQHMDSIQKFMVEYI
jgi:hypothetical protein